MTSSFYEKIALIYQKPCKVIFNENKAVFFRSEIVQNHLHLYLHRLFLEAPTPVLEAVFRFAVKKDKKALSILRQMVDLHYLNHPELVSKVEAKGVFVDLQEIYETVKKNYFDSEFHVHITWSNRKYRGKFRSITFGSYDRKENLIRIHPILDHPEIPMYFLEFLVYHEMLHAICLPLIDKNGKRTVHTSEFQKKEKLFSQYEKAKQWEKKSLNLLKKREIHGRT